ncbi:MAG: alkaline phosphatase family protein [Candidatus Aminicenantes bacterium]|nr:alkaline phosphatase family protein [Candidatus Aminicenantes bacterium]
MHGEDPRDKALCRRAFLKAGAGAAALAALGPGGGLVRNVFGKAAGKGKVLILGIDGMDPHLTGVWMKQGLLPSFAKLASRGSFKRLMTSTPPQSPVAWSNFITGMNPGGHGIFDFMHRDPKTYLPVFSASATEEAQKTIRLGDTILPIKGGTVKNLRQGRAFWQILEDHGVPATIFKIPSNYPPVPSKQRTFAGLNTPDLVGTYGTFNYYTNEPAEINEDIGGGRIHTAYVIGNRVDAKLPGPVNTFKADRPESEIDFRVYLDPAAAVAKIAFPDREIVLKEREWSPWIQVRFPLIPTQSVSGITRLYLKEVRPNFKLYIAPINIDPADAALPLSTPESYASELAKKFGPFYTKGLPADTAALDNGLLDEEEFLAQDNQVLEESRAILDYELNRFDAGVLFYYISNLDQRQHMFWRLLDPKHPAHDQALAGAFGNVIEKTYREADEILAQSLAKIDKDTSVIVMSDHGFNPYYRSFNLNTWLLAEGYHKFKNPFKKVELDIGFPSTDWSKTKAYGLGFNGLFINQSGREAEGAVAPGAETDALVREIAAKLEAFRDPDTGEQVILRAGVSGDIYSGDHVAEAPEITLEFNRGYRISFQSPLGRIPRDIVENNTAKWSGDHMGAAEVTQGVVLSDRPIKAESPALYDLTATILQAFGIERPEKMVGKPVF